MQSLSLPAEAPELTPPSQTVIQGTADQRGQSQKLSQVEIDNTVQFCLKSLMDVTPEQKSALTAKIQSLSLNASITSDADIAEIEKHLAADERQMLNALRSKNMLREDAYSIDSFALDAIDGYAPRLERGNLGLARAARGGLDGKKLYDVDYLSGKHSGIRAAAAVKDTKVVV